MLLEIVVILVLIMCNALLAMTELAVVSSRRSRLQQLVKRRHHGARVAMRLLENPTDFLSTVQVGITFVGMFAAAYSGATLAKEIGVWLDRTPWIAPYGQPAAIAVVTLAVTYVTVVFGELLPKRIALNDPERIASALAPLLRGIAKVLAPFVWLARSARFASRRCLRD
jgi:putative hemolysin